jgi:hypothetical protein
MAICRKLLVCSLLLTGSSALAQEQDAIVSEEIQRKSLEHVIDRAAVKDPPRLERVFGYSVVRR